MSSQIRLRLTGAAGGGTCVLMEEGGRLRYRLSLEGPPGGELTVLVQGRSPYICLLYTSSMGLAIALLLSGVGLGASYLASQKSITLLVGGQERYCITTAQSVAELLEEQGQMCIRDRARWIRGYGTNGRRGGSP